MRVSPRREEEGLIEKKGILRKQGRHAVTNRAFPTLENHRTRQAAF
jgi:hypothetical protein